MEKDSYSDKAAQSVAFISTKTKIRPRIGIIVGTGLGSAVSFLNVADSLSYGEIPHFPTPTVESHAGKFLFGYCHNQAIAVMHGRLHLYEGFTAQEVVFPVRVMRALGVEKLILTNAAGGLNPDFQPGDIMAIRDHINLTGENPLVGEHSSRGVRFPDMSQAYNSVLRRQAVKVANEKGILLKEGVYIGLTGPSLETPAEARFLRSIGADAVGFSTVMEVIAAVHAGMRVMAFSIIANVHHPAQPEPITLEMVLATAAASSPKISDLIRDAIDSPSAEESNFSP